MSEDRRRMIRKSREVLQDPYAHLQGDGTFDATVPGEPMSVHDARRLLRNPYAYLDGDGGYSEYRNSQENARQQPVVDVRAIRGDAGEQARYSRAEIQRLVRRLHRELWLKRAEIATDGSDLNPIDLLEPTKALKALGYATETVETLGQYRMGRDLFDVAGLVDPESNQVQISRRFDPNVRRFTAAHELGHIVLHPSQGLHRDRAVDGSSDGSLRDGAEIDADVFAAHFLMPERLVRQEFLRRFLSAPFAISDDTAFALVRDSSAALLERCRTLRDLARMVANAGQYDGSFFSSLAKHFGVSSEAMAIRLEELELVASERR